MPKKNTKQTEESQSVEVQPVKGKSKKEVVTVQVQEPEEVKVETKPKGKSKKEEVVTVQVPVQEPVTPPPSEAKVIPLAPVKDKKHADIEKEYDATKEEWAKIVIEEQRLSQEQEKLENVKKGLLKRLDELQKKLKNETDFSLDKLSSGVNSKVKKDVINHNPVSDSDSSSSSSDSDSDSEMEKKLSLTPKKPVVSKAKTLKLSKPKSESESDDDEDSD